MNIFSDVIVLHCLVAYSNHESSLENKILKKIRYELMIQGRSCFFEADSYLYYVVLNYINVLSIEGPNQLMFCKKRQACDLFFYLLILAILTLFIVFHYWCS